MQQPSAALNRFKKFPINRDATWATSKIEHTWLHDSASALLKDSVLELMRSFKIMKNGENGHLKWRERR